MPAAAKKAFAKGDKVTYLTNWDGKGTVTFQHAVVYACGKKQMGLTDDATGEEMGRHFRPENAAEVWCRGDGTFLRLTDEAATEIGLIFAAQILVSERAGYARRIEYAERERFSYWEGYVEGMRKDRAKLHEPRRRNA